MRWNIYLNLYFALVSRRWVLLHNTQCVENSAENGELSVLTLGSLCLPCCVQDTAWSCFIYLFRKSILSGYLSKSTIKFNLFNLTAYLLTNTSIFIYMIFHLHSSIRPFKQRKSKYAVPNSYHNSQWVINPALFIGSCVVRMSAVYGILDRGQGSNTIVLCHLLYYEASRGAEAQCVTVNATGCEKVN